MRNSAVAVCLISGFSFAPLFILSFYISSYTYPLFMDIPADLSRNTSWFYYGIIFSIFPYLVLGMLFGLLNAKIHKTAIVTIITTFIIEKIGLLLFASIISQRASGYNLLCEELPFYCSNYTYPYMLGSVVIGTLSFYSGYKLTKKIGVYMKSK
ncbi:hypothetical protein PV433_17540 [Paenibacillus sp. GYB004]|uniref:hypothetical protein n=1 Tax=Paenibacillus sp. GYB004 TaxID=2994393 RepID=UPI002F965CCB